MNMELPLKMITKPLIALLYFCSFGKKFNSSIETPINKVNISPKSNPKSIYLFDCTYTEASKSLQNVDVKKVSELDRIPGKVLKLFANILAYPVSYLVSLSFAKCNHHDCL